MNQARIRTWLRAIRAEVEQIKGEPIDWAARTAAIEAAPDPADREVE